MYVLAAAITELPQWQRAKFLTADMNPIKHEKEMRKLLQVLKRPQEVVIINCMGHSEAYTVVGEIRLLIKQQNKQPGSLVRYRTFVPDYIVTGGERPPGRIIKRENHVETLMSRGRVHHKGVDVTRVAVSVVCC